MSNLNKYEKLLYKHNRLKRHCGNQMNKIVEYKQELQRKDNEIKQLREDIVNHIKIASEYKEQMIIKDNIINEIEKYFFGELQLYGGGGIAEENYKKIIELKTQKKYY